MSPARSSISVAGRAIRQNFSSPAFHMPRCGASTPRTPCWPVPGSVCQLSASLRADIATWQPERRPDLIFANAVLQWLPDHQRLFPRLFVLLAPGGTLAVQVPDNFDEPSHRLMREVAAAGPWRDQIGGPRARAVLPPSSYYDLLAPEAAAVDVWRTAYQHPMRSAAAIVQWLRSTGLRPFIDPLPETDRPAFLRAYEEALAAAYPPRTDGLRLLAFPRTFIVARRRA